MTKRAAGFIPALLLIATGLCAELAGCKGSAAPGGNDNAAQEVKPIVKTAERGPVKMTVTADKDRITIAERLTLTIDVFAETGIEVDLGEHGDQLNEFQVRHFENNPEQTVEGGRRWTRAYDLDVFLSGEYSIPAISAHFTDRRPAKADAGEKPLEGEIRTEPFNVTVTSLLEGTVDPTQFRDIKGPVALPGITSRRWFWWASGGTAVVAAALLTWVLWRRRRPRAAQVPVKPPHEWAFDQLRELIDAKLVEQGLVHEFYFRLSQIVRVYIELRFGLMAPERTTDEFLTEARRSHALDTRHKTLLDDFLRSCDLVKFARYQPTTTEIEDAFNAARDFIQETAPRQAPQPVEAAA